MKLFFYYALHSFKNQLKKLFKTWVLVFFVACMLLGGIIGILAASLDDAITGDEVPEEEIVEEVPGEAEEIPPEILPGLLELIAGGVILLILVCSCVGADKNGSAIFLPADVNLLFASPLKPQSVLLFRLMTQLGLVVASALYLVFQLPNLVMNMGLSIWQAVGIMAALLMTLAIGKLLQVLLYVLTSTYTRTKKYLRKGLYALLLVVAGGFFLYTKSSGLDYFSAAMGFFNHKITRFIPLWGWLKAFFICVFSGNLLGLLLSFLGTVAGGGALVYIIWHIKADFYEDAMAKSQETAELQEIAQAENSTGFVKRKKDRSEKLRRDGLKHGWGANVLFFRVMYNRFRFAHFGIFTKTSETYLVAALGVGALCRFVIGTNGVIPIALVLGVLAFYRTLGNPLQEDSSKDFFRMIPESAGKKLFWSIISGTVTCFMDLIPAAIAAIILFPGSALTFLAWLPLILSVDFYGTNVTAFIDLSTPSNAGKTIKQLVAILFIYFGLLPDAIAIIVGITAGQIALGAVVAAAINFALGGLFLALTPLFLEPKELPWRPPICRTAEEMKAAKCAFSRLGLGCFVITVLSSIVQFLLAYFMPWAAENPYLIWVITFAPIYVVAVPISLLIFRKAKPVKLPKSSLGFGQTAKIVFICLFMMYGGNLIGQLVTGLFGSLIGSSTEPSITSFIMEESMVMKVLFIVILAPIIEEFLFRRQLIDRMAPYGEKLAVFTSALLFGLFHGNFSQFFYAFGLGLVFGYVYLKTGKLRYSIGLHMGINFLGSIFSSWLLENMGTITETGVLLEPNVPVIVIFIGYLAFALIGAIVGLVLLCRGTRKVSFGTAALELPKGTKFKTAYWNVGMILFVLSCIAMFVLSLIPV